MPVSRLYSFGLLLCLAFPLAASTLPCQPCAGMRLPTPEAVGGLPSLLISAHLPPGSPFFVAWEVPLAAGSPPASAAADLARSLARAGGTPFLSLVFTTPAPLTAHAEQLQAELQQAAVLAGALAAPQVEGTTFYFQVVWRPEGTPSATPAVDYAFLLKRAAVALTGALPDARVATEALPADAAGLEALYAQEVAAYVEVVALAPAGPDALAGAIASLAKLDPGTPVVLDAAPAPADPGGALADAARGAARGIGLTLFAEPSVDGRTLSPFALLARELAGDLAYDPSSAPIGAAEAWAFVRGKDLALRVIAVAPGGENGAPPAALALHFADPELRRPSRFPFAAGPAPAPAGRVTPAGLELTVPAPGRVTVLGLERTTAAERQGVAAQVTVASRRDIPVEEILRRLQAFEDAQGRKIDHYQAVNTTHLRFNPAAGAPGLEASLEGPFFFQKDTGADWAWKTLYLNGVRWRDQKLPQIPLIQPEKAAALPLEIHFAKQYRYRLRGTAQIDGRDAWVIDFVPEGPAAKEEKLYRGTVWVDRQVYARLRTRAVQVGLSGEVISNEETMHYTPIDAFGHPAAWSAQSFVLPLRLVAQQVLSVLDATTVVDRETLLTQVRINGPGFVEARRQVEASDVTMVRDTDKGLRYLVKDPTGQRVVQEGFAKSQLFGAGGIYYDDALSYPLPLAGIDYFSFDFKGSGKQTNLFFAGPFLTGSIAEPAVFGSRFDAGANLFGLAVPFTDNLFQGKTERHDEELKVLPESIGWKLGHPLGDFVKVSGGYSVLYQRYSRSDNTAGNFVLPSDNFLQSLDLDASFARSGYRLSAHGGYSWRSSWEFWGLPGNPDWSPAKRDFGRWDASAGKTWYLPYFQKAGVEVDYVSGSDLDRFSKYQFGFFGGTRVHGYQSNEVRADTAYLGHATYGFEVGETLRLDLVGDLAFATDRENGLHDERLAGLGLVGTVIGPWQTLVNLDFGVPVAGPDHGFVAYLVFLKLLGRK